MIALRAISVSLTIATIGLVVLYRASLKDGDREMQKRRHNIPTDYDGMGTFSRYINK